MQALLLTSNESEFSEFKNSFIKNFIGLKLEIAKDKGQFINKVSSEGPFSFFVVDAKFGEELEEILNSAMDLAGERPVVICGTDEDLLKINKAMIIKNESNTVLKDFKNSDKIKSVINNAIEWSKAKKEESEDVEAVSQKDESEYIGMKVRNLYLYESFPHNLYVKIGEQKYVLALEKETQIYHSQIAKLVQRKIKQLYIDKNKHIEFLERSIKNASQYFEQNRDFNKKTIMAHLRSAALIQDYLLNVGVSLKVSEFIEVLLDHIIESLDKANNFHAVCDHYTFNLDSVISKSVLTAYVNFFLMKEMGWKSSTVRRKFILASLIQDTFIENDALSSLKNLNDPKAIDFTEEEIRLFPEHPKLIAEIARQFTQFPDIDFLLEQHHELPTRDGFPNRPPPSEIQLAVCLFNLASNFAREIDGQEMKQENFKKIFRVYVKEFNVGNFKEPLAKLKKVLRID